MLSKQTVLPNFIRAAALLAIASLSFSANAGHHEKDAKKAKSEYMQKATDKMHGDEMKDKMGEKHKDMEGHLDASEADMDAGADAMKKKVQPE